MTYIYEWFSFPQTFSVKCPECGEECVGSDIFKQNTKVKCKPKVENRVYKVHLSCLACGLNTKRDIRSPIDAFWTFHVKGKILWAWSLEHSKVLMEYIKSYDRKEFNYSGYATSLFHLPEHFKLAKNRDSSIKAIEQVINKRENN